jgi:hypothetical protein
VTRPTPERELKSRREKNLALLRTVNLSGPVTEGGKRSANLRTGHPLANSQMLLLQVELTALTTKARPMLVASTVLITGTESRKVQWVI